MAIEVFKATSHLQEGIRVESTARGFKVAMDEPQELGGTNTAMNPVEAILCALGSCQCIVAKFVASKMGIELEDLKVELEGDLDPAGFQGDPNVRPGYQAVRSKFIVKSNASEGQIKSMIEMAEKFCPVGDVVSNGTKMSVDYVIEK